MKQFHIVTVVFFCAIFAGSNLFAMGGKKVNAANGDGQARDIASEGRDVASFESESKNIPHMLSYEEFRALSPNDRETYLYGVRDMMTSLAGARDKNSQFLVDSRLQEYRNILDVLLPKADAQWNNFEKPKSKMSGGSVRPRFLRNIGGRETWQSDCDSTDAVFNYDVGTCVEKHGPFHGNATPCDKSNYREVNLARGTVAKFFGAETDHYCVPNASWNQLAVSRRKELVKPEGAQSVASVFSGSDSKVGAEITFGAAQRVGAVDGALAYPQINEYRGATSEPTCNSKDQSIKYVADVGTCAKEAKNNSCESGFTKAYIVTVSGGIIRSGSAGKKAYCIPAASMCLLPDSRKTELQNSVKKFESGDNIVDNRASSGQQSETLEQIQKTKELGNGALERQVAGCAAQAGVKVSGNAQAAAKPRKSSRSDNGPAPASAETVASGNFCKMNFAADKCDDVKSRDDLRKQNEDFYRKNVNTCIYAGNVSHFKTKDNEAKKCEPRYSIPSLKLHCSVGVICNPVVFGVKEDGSAFCATKNDGEATLECDGLASSNPTKASWLADNVDKIKGEYDDLANGINNMCGRNQARNYYCGECNVILNRLNNLNYFVGNKNGAQCVAAKVQGYDDVVKPKENNKTSQ